MKREEFINLLYDTFLESYEDFLNKNPRLYNKSVEWGFNKEYFNSEYSNNKEGLFMTILNNSIYEKILLLLDNEESIEEYKKITRNIKKLY